MIYHFGTEDFLVSPRGDKYYPDITRFEDRVAVKSHCDSLQEAGYRMQRSLRYDLEHISADYLIRQIELAFEAWQKPWAREVPFEEFCRYVLPYRSGNEPLADVRQAMKDKYMALLDSAGAKNPMEACKILNERLKNDIRYAETGNPLTATVDETMRSGRGSCEALCNYAVLAMRAVGIPVAVHQTLWTRMERGHVWTAVWWNGCFYDFSPGDVHADAYQDVLRTRNYLKPAKVYRWHYETTGDVLPGKEDGYVTFLKNPLLEDVTDEQPTPVYTLSVPIDSTRVSGKGDLLYLCTFNTFSWKPIALGYNDGKGHAVFRKVAGRNFFIVAEAAEGGELHIISPPVCTEADGSIKLLTGSGAQKARHTFSKGKWNEDFLLSYWDCTKKAWMPLKCEVSTDTTQTHGHVPVGTLLFHRTVKTSLHNYVGMIDGDGIYKSNKDL